MSSEECSCNKSKEKTNTCFRCRTTWSSNLSYEERVSDCPVHYMSIAICGVTPPLCSECEKEGYYLKSGKGFFDPPVLLKK